MAGARARRASPHKPGGLNEAATAFQKGDFALAARAARLETERSPDSVGAWELLSVAEYRQANTLAAVDAARRAAALQPANASLMANLGAMLRAVGRSEEAEVAYLDAITADPALVSARRNLGNLLADRGRLAEAETAFREAVRLAPRDAEGARGLANVLQRQGRLEAATAEYKRLVALAPDDAQALNDLGVCEMGLDRHAGALAALERAIALRPGLEMAHGNLGALHLRTGRLHAALDATRRAHQLSPDEHRWISNLAVIAKDLGRFDESEALFRRALALRPDYASGHSNLLFCLNYHPDKPAEAIFEEYRRWDQAQAAGKAPTEPVWLVDHNPDRRLRVGFVSPDFREHAARHFIEPFLRGLDRDRFEVVCYAELARPDQTSERLRAMADVWRLTAGMSDEAVAEMIRQDRIDILVDLGGHTASSRLLAFAYRPAPIQVAHMLGHGYTSGLSAIDVFLGDNELTPEGSDHLFSEKLLRLSRIPLGYQPPENMPAVKPTPALAKGHVTFGYFGRPERINARVIAAWAAILKGVPSSRLMLNAKAFAEPAFRAVMEQGFGKEGIGPDRLELVFTTPQPVTWEAYGDIDIALDPFPHNAGTTTIEALYLGVPVLSLKDRPSVGRFGASILGALGLSDWAVDDVGAYVAKAIAEASDLQALDGLRQSLRQRFNASPLADTEGLGRELGQAFTTLWKDWCADGTAANAPSTDELAGRAVAAFGAGDSSAAEALASEALLARPDHFDALHVRGVARYRLGRLADAATDLAGAIALSPTRPEPRWNLTAVLRAKGELAAAVAQGREAIRVGPGFAEAHNNLGSVYQDLAWAGEAETRFREAIRLRPDYAEAWSNLAWTLNSRGLGVEAEAASRKAIMLRPTDANAFNNLGSALMQLDRLEEAADAFRQAVAFKPDFAMAHSNLLFCLNYSPTLTGEAVFAEYRRWNEMHARGLAQPRAFTFDPDPARRLKVGYVSPDFRNHAVSYFVEPMLAAHDRSRVELYCYSETRNVDAVTERFKALADHWRPTVGLSDDEVAAMILRDGIDVLVDLAGHTASNRLGVFARRAAPVQVAYMVGSGATTGLDEMDAFISDAAMAPPGAEAVFSEQIIRLPRIPLIYNPPAGMPEPSPSPALAKGHVTFGCFSRTARINDRVLDAWATILTKVPTARLMLNAKPFQEKAMRKAFRARFAERGVKASRLDLVYTTPQPTTWAAYADIDIALDPFPHNAGTTTFEALWLGVPVVSLADRAPVGRFGKSILGAAGLDDWATDDVASYVAKAVKAARDVPALASLREDLRARVEASPLRDAAGLARALEAAYRDLYVARAS